MVERLGVIRPHGERAVVAHQRRVFFAQLFLYDSEEIMRIKKITFGIYDSLAYLLGFNELPSVVRRNSAAKRLRWGESELGHFER